MVVRVVDARHALNVAQRASQQVLAVVLRKHARRVGHVQVPVSVVALLVPQAQRVESLT